MGSFRAWRWSSAVALGVVVFCLSGCLATVSGGSDGSETDGGTPSATVSGSRIPRPAAAVSNPVETVTQVIKATDAATRFGGAYYATPNSTSVVVALIVNEGSEEASALAAQVHKVDPDISLQVVDAKFSQAHWVSLQSKVRNDLLAQSHRFVWELSVNYFTQMLNLRLGEGVQQARIAHELGSKYASAGLQVHVVATLTIQR